MSMIFQNKEIFQNRDGKWYFLNETRSDKIGPYDTEAECRKKLKEYINYLDKKDNKMKSRSEKLDSGKN